MTEARNHAAGEFTPRIGKVARRELALHGYTRYEQLPAVTAAALLTIHGVGPKAIRILAEDLEAQGIGFADDPGPAFRSAVP